jgi:hypothetical protein
MAEKSEGIRWPRGAANVIDGRRGKGAVPVDVPLPIPVDEVSTWNEVIPDEFDLLLVQHGVVPLAKGELHRLYPDRFTSPHAARHACGPPVVPTGSWIGFGRVKRL